MHQQRHTRVCLYAVPRPDDTVHRTHPRQERERRAAQRGPDRPETTAHAENKNIMTDTIQLDLDMPEPPVGTDNITDWCLQQFHDRYGNHITKDDIWEYLYGIMHAPDWRERYRHDLQRNLPRIPLADDIEAFRAAGRKLVDLHINYETCDEHPLVCLVDNEPDEGDADPEVYRIDKRMRWGKNGKKTDKTVLRINDRCQLVGIPDEAHQYTVSGRSPLQWAIDSLRFKTDKKSGITDDPNGWHDWADKSFNLIRHLRRLTHLSIETARTVAELPPSLAPEPKEDTDA